MEFFLHLQKFIVKKGNNHINNPQACVSVLCAISFRNGARFRQDHTCFTVSDVVNSLGMAILRQRHLFVEYFL
jgi:hypothetical protein